MHKLFSQDERNHNEVQHKVQHKILAFVKKNNTIKSNIMLNIRQLHELLSQYGRNHNEVQNKVQQKIIA